jgi:hypothetical protein
VAAPRTRAWVPPFLRPFQPVPRGAGPAAWGVSLQLPKWAISAAATRNWLSLATHHASAESQTVPPEAPAVECSTPSHASPGLHLPSQTGSGTWWYAPPTLKQHRIQVPRQKSRTGESASRLSSRPPAVLNLTPTKQPSKKKLPFLSLTWNHSLASIQASVIRGGQRLGVEFTLQWCG